MSCYCHAKLPRLQHDRSKAWYVSDVEFNSVELNSWSKNRTLYHVCTNSKQNVFKGVYDIWMELGTAVARRLKNRMNSRI